MGGEARRDKVGENDPESICVGIETGDEVGTGGASIEELRFASLPFYM